MSDVRARRILAQLREQYETVRERLAPEFNAAIALLTAAAVVLLKRGKSHVTSAHCRSIRGGIANGMVSMSLMMCEGCLTAC